MKTSKPKKPAKSKVVVKDLKPKKDPKGGKWDPKDGKSDPRKWE